MQKRFAEAIELLERASRLDPANIGILLDLGRMYGLRYNLAAAERCFEKALRLTPSKTKTLAIVGRQSEEFASPAMAEGYYRRASEQADATPEMLVQLAKLQERQRHSNEAGELIERALRLNPQCAEAQLIRARLARQAGLLENAEKTLLSLLQQSQPDAWLQAQALYELAQITDRQGRYDDAMAFLDRAKQLMQLDSPRWLNELKIVRNRLTEMQANLSVEKLRHWFENAVSLQPARRIALLGGHPRSGTTLLEQVLDSHPDIKSVEETTIFHDDAYMPLANNMPHETPMVSVLEAADNEALLNSRKSYFRSVESFLGQSMGSRLLIDKNPSLTFLIPPLLRIFPEIKLLIALRDPRDVVLSCFMQPLPMGQVSAGYLSLENTIEEYCAMMRLWLALRPMIAGHYLEVRYEDMVEDLESVARQSLTFLGVPWDAQVLGFDAHARQKLVRSPTYADVTQPVYKRAKGRWRNYQKYLEPHLARLESFVKTFGYD
jgi:tetratricopeptide (TPR) repeat protein